MKRFRIVTAIAGVLTAIAIIGYGFSPVKADRPVLHGVAAAKVAGLQSVSPRFVEPRDPFFQPTPAPTPIPGSGGLYVASVTMAEGVNGSDNSPVNPTSVFSSTATFHAVALIQNAPIETNFSASWYAVDVGSAAPPNTLIDSAQVITDGTRYIDFSLTPPTSSWPTGLYMVEIDVNGNKAAQIYFTVQ